MVNKYDGSLLRMVNVALDNVALRSLDIMFIQTKSDDSFLFKSTTKRCKVEVVWL